jgi:DNA-binding XRE family transcriptional regulator
MIYNIIDTLYQILQVVVNTIGFDNDRLSFGRILLMTNIKEHLGSNISHYRTQLGISQAKLAETVDMAANYLGLVENGKKFPSSE